MFLKEFSFSSNKHYHLLENKATWLTAQQRDSCFDPVSKMHFIDSGKKQ